MPDQPPRHLRLVPPPSAVVSSEPLAAATPSPFDAAIDSLPPYPHLLDLEQQPISGRAALATALAVLEWAEQHLPPSIAARLRWLRLDSPG